MKKLLITILFSFSMLLNFSCQHNASDTNSKIIDSESNREHSYCPERLVFEYTFKYTRDFNTNVYNFKVINDVFYCTYCGDKYYTYGCKKCIVTTANGQEITASSIANAYRSIGFSKSMSAELASRDKSKLRNFYYEKGYEKDFPAKECK